MINDQTDALLLCLICLILSFIVLNTICFSHHIVESLECRGFKIITDMKIVICNYLLSFRQCDVRLSSKMDETERYYILGNDKLPVN